MDLIAEAKLMDEKVEELRANYIAVRDSAYKTDPQKLTACFFYRRKKLEQDRLYELAMEKTAELYHVKPDKTDIVIGKPDDPRMNYIWGSTATWKPQVTESGPDLKLALKINGADDLPHYLGATKMNPFEDKGKAAVTVPDGRVLILKGSFDLALEKENPTGFLASLIYHESRHFNQLSRPREGSAVRRSLGSNEADEMRAYLDVIDHATDFGLSEDDLKFFNKMLTTNRQAVLDNKLTYPGLTPAQEEEWKTAYQQQLNLEEEYADLQAKHEKTMLWLKNLEIEKRAERERLAREEQERAEQEQRAREEENVRQSKQTAAFYERQEFLNEIARCWYTPIYRNLSDYTIIGFEDDGYRRHYYNYENGTPSVQDLKIMALIMRACDDVDRHIPPDKHKACNDAAPELRNPMRYDLMQNIEKATVYASAECVNTIMANRAKINDSRSFEKVVAEFHKADNRKKAEKDKQKRKEKERNEREETPGGGSLPPYEKRHYYDPSCNCWVREL